MASPASNATSKAVALALRDLALSQGDQEGLFEFLTDYFTSDNHEFSSGKQKHSINKASMIINRELRGRE